MSCSRNGCNNIMCDTYVDGVGYICYRCQSQFKEYILEWNIYVTTDNEARERLKDFMITEASTDNTSKALDIDEFFRSYNS